MREIKWTYIGILASCILVLPILWQSVDVVIAIKQAPQEIISLHNDMTNNFALLETQIKDVDNSSIQRDKNIVVEFHKEIADNRNVAATNFSKILKRIDGGIKIDP